MFIVMHIPASRKSLLPDVLSACGKLPVINPKPHTNIEPGRIYVAPPDYHLLVEADQRISLWHGPKENNFRPSINPLFRSAAEVYRKRVVGVILTGSLEDGVAGLAWVKRHGGTVVVQDPRDAAFPAMPQSALQHVEVDYVTPISGLARLLVDLANGVKPAPVRGS